MDIKIFSPGVGKKRMECHNSAVLPRTLNLPTGWIKRKLSISLLKKKIQSFPAELLGSSPAPGVTLQFLPSALP